uniref:glycerophosphodiester phosphodiesterase family protein n=1 Tax=Ndongobacter massiliensis TaxID=1871025 RepID=UPI0009309EAC|nr:glycerophosphodiester phosphodiesterase family protein [Ndongobacter massiliensis]
MKIFAHRGYSAKYPENSMLAFQKAVEVGCDAIELDVHFSRDYKLVIIHDDALSRTTNAVGFVRHHSLRDLQNYELTGDYEGDPQHILTLEEYLRWAKDRPIQTNIELKNDRFRYPGMEEAVMKLIHAMDMFDQVLLSSFSAESIALLKLKWPQMRCGWLIDEMRDTTLDKALEIKADSLHPSIDIVDEELIVQVHETGLSIYAYTANSDEELERMKSLGVDGLFTDELERARAHFGLHTKPYADKEVQAARTLQEKPARTAKDRLRLSRKARGISGGLFGIFIFMIVSIAGSVIAAKLVMGLLGRFFPGA